MLSILLIGLLFDPKIQEDQRSIVLPWYTLDPCPGQSNIRFLGAIPCFPCLLMYFQGVMYPSNMILCIMLDFHRLVGTIISLEYNVYDSYAGPSSAELPSILKQRKT